MISFEKFGKGPNHVVVMHDWFCDRSSYNEIRPYLDTDKYTFIFIDLRGYGESKNIEGEYVVEEAAADVIEVADHLGLNRFHLVGHSMSGMIAQYIALKLKDRLKSVVAITPTPACGSPAPDDMMTFLVDAATVNDMAAAQAVGFMSGQRLCDKFVKMKVAKWRQIASAKARVGYLKMFSNTDFSKEMVGLETSFLVIAGEHDVEGHQLPRMKETIGTWLRNAEIVECKNSAHYPMQETPVHLVTLIENHFAKNL